VFADVPKLDITVSQVTNVTSDCQPAANGTASDLVFHNLTLVVPTLGFDIGWNVTALDHEVTDDVIQLGSNVTLPTSCLDYAPKASALGPVPDKSTSGGSVLRLDIRYLSLAAVTVGVVLMSV
jgi:hypothetical protein